MSHERCSLNDRRFMVHKFRTMVADAEKRLHEVKALNEADGPVFKINKGPRIIPYIGTLLRKTSLDELPQIINVLQSEMSLVGPRPERQYFVEQFKKDISDYKVRHLVKSGITGWAQVNGWRGDTSIERRIACDIEYLEKWTFSFDLKIIWLTVFGRETNRNAYYMMNVQVSEDSDIGHRMSNGEGQRSVQRCE